MPSLYNDALSRPLTVRSLTLKNRIVMAPMTRTMAPGGIPGQQNSDYYRRRAEGQVGLILSEGTVIDRPASQNALNVPHFYGEHALTGWGSVIDAVHDAGGRMGPQLWHTGSTKHLEWEPASPVESPSGLVSAEVRRGKSMTDEDIEDTIAAYARAAADARRLGFDLVEVLGAHGYLIDQFFWAATNLRDDRYGGTTLKERSRFAVELISAVRTAVGSDFPISLRISQWKQQDYKARLAQSPNEMADWLVPLVEAGVDILHCSQRRYWEPEFPDIDGEDGLNLAGWAKKLTGATTISVGSVGLSSDSAAAFRGESSNSVELDRLTDRMERDEFDLIAVGRALLTDPNWAAKILGQDTGELMGFDPKSLSELS